MKKLLSVAALSAAFLSAPAEAKLQGWGLGIQTGWSNAHVFAKPLGRGNLTGDAGTVSAQGAGIGVHGSYDDSHGALYYGVDFEYDYEHTHGNISIGNTKNAAGAKEDSRTKVERNGGVGLFVKVGAVNQNTAFSLIGGVKHGKLEVSVTDTVLTKKSKNWGWRVGFDAKIAQGQNMYYGLRVARDCYSDITLPFNGVTMTKVKKPHIDVIRIRAGWTF